MKIYIIKTISSFLLFKIISSGCTKNNNTPNLLEINPDTEETVIKYDTQQIEFEFCLLNKERQPATVFNNGDNLIFSFSFKNNSADQITVTTEFINSDFFRVYLTQNNTDMGKPWTGIWCLFIGQPQEINIAPQSMVILRYPWILDENNMPDYPLSATISLFIVWF